MCNFADFRKVPPATECSCHFILPKILINSAIYHDLCTCEGTLDSDPFATYSSSKLWRGSILEDQVDKERLKALEDKIAAVKKSTENGAKSSEGVSAGEVGWRMVTELVAGIFIGCGIGYGLDVLFGTMPIFLVLFTLFGFAAGIKTMMRSANELQEKAVKAAEDERV